VVSREIKVIILGEISVFSNYMQGWAIAYLVDVVDVGLKREVQLR